MTYTETFSTSELIRKTSVLPVVVNGRTKHHTLTHSYYVTRLVEAIKVRPTMASYDFIPTSAFTDLGNVLDEAGSEKNEEHQLPGKKSIFKMLIFGGLHFFLSLSAGELEFSDQEDFSNGPHEVRLRPPPGFNEDLTLIGSKFDPIDSLEKKKAAALNTAPNLQSSFAPQQQLNPFAGFKNPFAGLFQQQQQQQQQQASTPSLPNQFGFSPEQMQQLALLQYLQNSFGGLAGLPNLAGANPFTPQQQQNNPFAPQQQQNNVIVASKPVIRTETLYETNTIPLLFGNKKLYSTVTSAIGVTTITEYEQEMRTIAPAAANSFQQQLPQINQQFNPLGAAAGAQPRYIITSEPIVRDTVLPSTIYKEIKITFRNKPTLTTLTSTTMVSTQVTEYVTKTVRAPAASALAYNPLAALFAAG
jgi:hypothetical protein